MTQLEQELKQALKLQEEMFKSELERVTQQYLKDLNQIVSGQQTIIDGQSEELKLYENASRNISIRLEDNQVGKLTKQVEDLTRQLAKLN